MANQNLDQLGLLDGQLNDVIDRPILVLLFCTLHHETIPHSAHMTVM